ncbi:MAG: hypothetical protein H6Q17_2830 [Bacteroidetes bacterium]|nr:hypothetical protein [Bacteroidota bacterium]
MSKVNDDMQRLTALWYNTMVAGLHLSDQSFQLYQGPNTLITDDQLMWNIFNAVPPKAINNYYNPSQVNNFTGNYGLILGALVATPDTSFKSCLGDDYYNAWQTYFKDYRQKHVEADLTNAKTISNIFTNWAIVNAPEKVSCVAGLTKTCINPINIANIMYSSVDAAAGGSYAWNNTLENLKKALASGATIDFELDSSDKNISTTHSWAGGNVSVLFNIFSFNGSGKYDDVSYKTTSEGFHITAHFGKVTTFTAGPYTQHDAQDPTLKDFPAWYNSAALSLAYTNGEKVWSTEKGKVTWNDMFGPNGHLQRMVSSLVVADDITIIMKSEIDYTSSELTEIQAAAKAGVWPFFQAEVSGGITNKVDIDEKGRFTCTTTIPAGHPQILGILQSPMSTIF